MDHMDYAMDNYLEIMNNWPDGHSYVNIRRHGESFIHSYHVYSEYALKQRPPDNWFTVEQLTEEWQKRTKVLKENNMSNKEYFLSLTDEDTVNIGDKILYMDEEDLIWITILGVYKDNGKVIVWHKRTNNLPYSDGDHYQVSHISWLKTKVDEHVYVIKKLNQYGVDFRTAEKLFENGFRFVGGES